MKLLQIFLITVVLLAFANCGTMQGSGGGGMDYSNLQSLEQVLRLQPGLTVQGSGNAVKVSVRGVQSMALSVQPLYIINGTNMGHNYASANQAINVRDITSVRVLASKHETTIYGEDGNNGVIIIKTSLAGQ